MKMVFSLILLALGEMVLHAEDALDVARAAMQDQLYDIAQLHAQKQLDASNGKNPDALALLVEALAEQGLDQRVLNVLDHYSNVVVTAKQPALFTYWHARSLLNLKKADEAVVVLARTPPPKNDLPLADALLRLTARAKKGAGDVVGALDVFALLDTSTTNFQTRAANLLEWGLTLESLSKEIQALDVLARLSKIPLLNTDVADGLLLRSRLLLRQGKYDESFAAYDQLATNQLLSSRIRVQAYTEMSDGFLKVGKTNEAISFARSAYALAQQPETRRLAGFYLSSLLCADAATLNECNILIKTLVREFPDDPLAMDAHLKLADAFLRYRFAARAADEYRLVLETYSMSSKNDHVLLGRGWALFQLKRYTEASGVFQRVAEQTTNQTIKAESLFKWGDSLTADKRYIDAATVFARLIDETPQSSLVPRAYYQRAECLERAGHATAAMPIYQQLIALYPKHEYVGKALLRLGALFVANGELDAAIRTYTSIQTNATLKTYHCDAFMGRGNVNYRLYRFDAAMKDFDAAGEADPSRRDEARHVITRCLYALGRDKEAQASAQAFITEFPGSSRLPDMILWVAKFDYSRGKSSEARKLFVDYVTRWPDAEWADASLLWAARAAIDDADFTGAVELVARLVREYPKSTRITEARYVQSNALMELARFSEAVLILDQVIATDPGSEWIQEVKLRKGDCLFAMGADNTERYLKALATYREVLQYPTLSPSQTLQINYKIARCLEKLNRIDEAIDAYYADVVIRYQNTHQQGVWYDDSAAGLFVRAAFNVADLYERKGRLHAAIKVLERVLDTDAQGKDEVQARIDRLRKKS